MGKQDKSKFFKITTSEDANYEVCFKKCPLKESAEGLCDNPQEFEYPKILIDPNLLPKRKMAVIIEELYHAENFEHTEKKARKFAANLTKILYGIGFRLKN